MPLHGSLLHWFVPFYHLPPGIKVDSSIILCGALRVPRSSRTSHYQTSTTSAHHWRLLHVATGGCTQGRAPQDSTDTLRARC
jgi:hypothetical protein